MSDLDECGDSTIAVRSVPPSDGGAIPTSPLRLRKSDWRVANVGRPAAKRLIEQYHYAKGASSFSVYLHGLYPADKMQDDDCVGVAWWLSAMKPAGAAIACDQWRGVLALSRLVIHPDVPPNACSFLLSKSVMMIDRTRWHTLVTYADSWRGHTGAIYRAAGWEYCGETDATAVYTVNGRMTATRNNVVTRTHDEMMQLGAELVGRFRKSRFCLRRR